MKRFLKIPGVIVILLMAALIWGLYPKFSNMSSEYGTAGAIGDIESFVIENDGKWPSSSKDLKDRYPVGGKVSIDYSITSEEIIADPAKLKEAVRPRSGKFYTYPHYDQQIENLLKVLKASRERAQLADQLSSHDRTHPVGNQASYEAQADQLRRSTERSFTNLTDPRQWGSLSEWINDGEEVENTRSISNSIFIISWLPDPEGNLGTYQIGGIEGYHSFETINSFLTNFYDLDDPKTIYGKPNVIVAGNNWGTGRELGHLLKDLSKRHKFSVFYLGGWGFMNAVLSEEQPGHLKPIKAAFEKIEGISHHHPPAEKTTAQEVIKPDIRGGVWNIPLRYWAHLSPVMDGGLDGFIFLCEVAKLGPDIVRKDELPSRFKTGDLTVLETLNGSKRFPIFKTLKTLQVEGCDGLQPGDRVIVFVDRELYEGGYVINNHEGTNCLLGHRLLRNGEAESEVELTERRQSETKLVEFLKSGRSSIEKASSDDLHLLSTMDPEGVRKALIREREIKELSKQRDRPRLQIPSSVPGK